MGDWLRPWARHVILLNIFDVDNPVINGLPPVDKGNLIRKVKELTGRPVGINLEPKEQGVESSVEADSMWGNHGWPSGERWKMRGRRSIWVSISSF